LARASRARRNRITLLTGAISIALAIGDLGREAGLLRAIGVAAFSVLWPVVVAGVVRQNVRWVPVMRELLRTGADRTRV
jgi:hypothetical protein